MCRTVAQVLILFDFLVNLEHEFLGQRLLSNVVEAGLIAFFFGEAVLHS